MTCFVPRPSGITLVKFHSLQDNSIRSNSGEQVARSSTLKICCQDRHPQAASTPEEAELYPASLAQCPSALASGISTIIHLPVLAGTLFSQLTLTSNIQLFKPLQSALARTKPSIHNITTLARTLPTVPTPYTQNSRWHPT